MNLNIKTTRDIDYWQDDCTIDELEERYNTKWVSVGSLLEYIKDMYDVYNPVEINKKISSLVLKLSEDEDDN